MRDTWRAPLAVLLVLLLAVPPALRAEDTKKDPSKIGQRKVGGGVNLYSLEREISFGKQLAQMVEQSARLVQDPVVNEYVDRVAQNLVRNSDARVPFTVKVIDSDEINAFALPGGFFFINSGLVLAADEEAELAGVMAHEIAHVTARHVTKNLTRYQITQWALIPLMIFGPVGWAGYGIWQGLNFGLPLAFMQFSRGFESEADYLGLQYMYKAGYDPTAFISFFEKIREIERKRPGSVPKIFSSHPPTRDRVENAQKEIANILPAREEYVVTTSEFELVKQRLALVMAGRKIEDEQANRPTLRKDKRDKDGKEGEKKEDKPPVLKRRDKPDEKPQEQPPA